MSAAVSTSTRLTYASGYLALGLHADAVEELDAIAAGEQDSLPVLTLRNHACVAARDWAGAAALGALLCSRDPAEAEHWIQWAYATRRHLGIPAAREILLNALGRHVQEPILHFNLACYEAQLGEPAAARQRLRAACALEPSCRKMALADEDLEPLHAWISAGMKEE